MSKRIVIIGGGPAGNRCATVAASLGAVVTIVERDIVGGAAHLWDCIPSKAMIATGDILSRTRSTGRMGLSDVHAELDFIALRARSAGRVSADPSGRGNGIGFRPARPLP